MFLSVHGRLFALEEGFEDLCEERGSAASDAYIGSGTATAPPPDLLKLSEHPHTTGVRLH